MSSSARRKKISFGSSVSSTATRSCASYASPSASAFWKIVGFDVTPVTASSAIICASLPLATRSRESVSNHTATPRSLSLCSRDLATLHRPFHLGDFLEPCCVTRLDGIELRGDERGHELACDGRADHLRAEAEHVHVVVLDALVRAVDVVADRRPDAGHLAGGDGLAALDPLADLARLVRVVDAHRRVVRAEVDHVVVGERSEHRLAELDAAVVERDRDP